MTDPAISAEVLVERRAIRLEVSQLIEAIDRRVPRLEHVGEAKIAAEAAELRAKAVKLLAELDADDASGA